MKFTRRQAEYFCEVAEVLHFGQAAESLYVSQAVVSQEIRRVEDGLGYRLFDRSTRRVALTPEGADLLPFAQRLLDAAGTLDTVASRFADGVETPVRLGASPSAMDYFVPTLLREIEIQLGIPVEEVPVETGKLGQEFSTGSLDIGIGRFPNVGDQCRVSQLYDEPMLVVISTNHASAKNPAVDLALLADLPLLLWPREQDPGYYDRILAVCRDRGLDPLVMTGRATILGARSYLLSEGRVFVLIPASSVHRLDEGIVARPISAPVTFPMSLVTLAGDPRPRVNQVVALARRVAANMSFT
jgi:DNA-binding transcriptional LysR family regulator